MNYGKLKKIALKASIGFLILTALVAIISVLTGTFGKFQLKILATTFAISAASVCAMACAAFIEKKKLVKPGVSGIFLSVAAAVLVIVGIWGEIRSSEYWKTVSTLSVLAAASAHAALLALRNLGKAYKRIKSAAIVSVGVLAVLIIVAVWMEINDDTYFRILIVAAIITALGTLIIPILEKMKVTERREEEQLVLDKVREGVYTDSTGKVYSVNEIDNELREEREDRENGAEGG